MTVSSCCGKNLHIPLPAMPPGNVCMLNGECGPQGSSRDGRGQGLVPIRPWQPVCLLGGVHALQGWQLPPHRSPRAHIQHHCCPLPGMVNALFTAHARTKSFLQLSGLSPCSLYTNQSRLAHSLRPDVSRRKLLCSLSTEADSRPVAALPLYQHQCLDDQTKCLQRS